MEGSPNAPDAFSLASLRTLRVWGGALFFFSGLTGLVYEILWTRRLNLTFGHSVLAVSTVVTAYMAGLALGSFWGGRWSDRRVQRGENASWFLASYGKLEGLIGLWALLSLPLLGWVEAFYLALSARGMQGLSLYWIVFAASLLVLVPPTTAMGATLPIVSCLYGQDSGGLGRTLSRLYATNTFGAVCGVVLAGFLLLPQLGLRWSMVLASLLNLTIAAISLVVSSRLTGQLKNSPAVDPQLTPSSTNWILPTGFALTGALSMAAQLGWTRSLSLSLGSSVYAFSSILVVFLCGLALGSSLYERWFGKTTPEWRHLAGLSLGVGVTSVLAIPVLGRLPLLFVACFPFVRDHYWQVILLDLVLCGLVLILPTSLMGLAFPLATQLNHQITGQIGRSVGNIYSSNTLGCILGSSLTGFVLIPNLGVQRTLELAACGCCWVAALYARQSSSRGWRKSTALLLVLGVGPLAIPDWDPALAASGLATHGALLRTANSRYLPHQPAYHRDGLSGTVSVLMWGPGGLTMRVNGKPEASLAVQDRAQQTILGLLPLLYVASPRRVGVIGLGSGLTLTATASSPDVVSAECAELEPCVIEAEKYFAPYNQQILKNPKVKARYADGRTMVMGSPTSFDVLVSVPSNPWVAGIGNLYTQDFYRSCRAKLNPGGVIMQWLNLYAMSPRDLQIVLRTFSSVFPEGQLWSLGGDLALVGGSSAANLDGLKRYYASSSYLRLELADLGMLRPEQILGAYACPLSYAIKGAPDVPLNTDDRPCLEYSAPFSLYSVGHYSANLAWAHSLRTGYNALPPGLQASPQIDLAASLGSLLYTQFYAARTPAQTVPGWSELALLFSGGQPSQERVRQSLKWLQRFPHWREARVWLAQDLRLHGTYQDVLGCFPSDVSPKAIPNEAERYFWLSLRAQIKLTTSQWQEALADYSELAKMRKFSDFDSAISLCYANLKNWKEAKAYSDSALLANPYDPRARFVQAEVMIQQGRREEALSVLQKVCQDCPAIQGAWLKWAVTLANLGRSEEAKKVLLDYLVFNPEDKQIRGLLQQFEN